MVGGTSSSENGNTGPVPEAAREYARTFAEIGRLRAEVEAHEGARWWSGDDARAPHPRIHPREAAGPGGGGGRGGGGGGGEGGAGGDTIQ